MAIKVYSNKCKWCGVTVDSKEPVAVCECCGSTDIESTSYFSDKELPKTHKEEKAEAALLRKKSINRWLIAIGSVIGAGLFGAIVNCILKCL